MHQTPLSKLKWQNHVAKGYSRVKERHEAEQSGYTAPVPDLRSTITRNWAGSSQGQGGLKSSSHIESNAYNMGQVGRALPNQSRTSSSQVGKQPPHTQSRQEQKDNVGASQAVNGRSSSGPSGSQGGTQAVKVARGEWDCNLCLAGQSGKEYLLNHVKHVHPEYFTCASCARCYTTNQQLDDHVKRRGHVGRSS
ncbi:hypothetical protein JB92DRAFT_2962220 [Gautieria morchelliformis]|nr:hypothetical protein JB92DRAFT_2962220 [Gautieria morchelliformis]